MKVRFYPRDVGMFRTGEFDFSLRMDNKITCEARYMFDYKDFHDREELVQWLKAHNVRLDDAENPLTFKRMEEPHHRFGDGYIVIQWTFLGWMIEL